MDEETINKESASSTRYAFGAALIFLGTLLALVACFPGIAELRFISSAEKTQGTVSNTWVGPATDGSTSNPGGAYDFQVKGKPYDGQFHGNYTVGQPINIEYDRDNPKSNRAAGVRDLPTYAAIFFTGVGMILIGLLLKRSAALMNPGASSINYF